MATDLGETIATASFTAKQLIPLSAAQRRLWYMSQVGEHNPYYNVTVAMRLRFAVDVTSLRKALALLIERHEILRTCYPIIDGVPMQRVLQESDSALTVVHRPTANGPARDEIIDNFARNAARTHLALEATPPFRCSLLSVDADDHLLVLLTHHLATDQRSINLLTAELEELYDADAGKRQSTLAAPVPYRDFVQWEIDEQHRYEDACRAYWDRELMLGPQPLPLPFDRSPIADSARLGAEHRFHLDGEATQRLRAFCRRGSATEFMGLLTVWISVLHGYCRCPVVFVGTTTAFREHSRFNRSLGCFINTLAIGIEIRDDDTFGTLLRRTREKVMDAFEHAGFSYERLVDRLRRLGLGAQGDFINAYFQFQPRSMSATADVKRRFQPNIGVHNGRAKFPLMLNVSDRGATLECTLEYESDAFSAQRIETIASDLVSAIEAACADADARLDSVAAHQRPRWACVPKPLIAVACSGSDESVVTREFTATEQQLAVLWTELLLVAPTSPADEFLQLGGHSFLVAQLAWKIRQSIGAAVRIRDLLAAMRLDEMARLVDAAPRGGAAHFSGRPATDAVLIGTVPCQLELGTWTIDTLNALMASVAADDVGAGQRVARIAFAFWGTPFQFESYRPLPLPGRLPVRLGAFDCATFVYTALAMGLSRDFVEFVTTLRALRYLEPEHRTLDSNPESGTIFDFVEESLVVNAVARGLLVDATPQIAAGAALDTVEVRLLASRRAPSRDPLELWAVPKLGDAPISLSLLPLSSFRRTESQRALRSGDIVLMARRRDRAMHVVDHIGIAHVDSDGVYLLQSTRHFACSTEAAELATPRYTGIYYDALRQCEQIGVGIGGAHTGDAASFRRNGLDYHGYVAGGRRPLVDYLEGVGFDRLLVLRPCLPPTASHEAIEHEHASLTLTGE